MFVMNRLILLSRRPSKLLSLAIYVKHAPTRRFYSEDSPVTSAPKTQSVADERSSTSLGPRGSKYNVQGGPGGSVTGGSSITNGPLTDTILATLVGLGVGKHRDFFLRPYSLTCLI